MGVDDFELLTMIRKGAFGELGLCILGFWKSRLRGRKQDLENRGGRLESKFLLLLQSFFHWIAMRTMSS